MTEPAPDGRTQRRVVTKKKLVEAHATLLRGGEVAPTAAQIAEEAGVSLRTLWTVFGDMEALLQATSAHWAAGEAALHSAIDPLLALDERIVLFCAERERRNEFIAPAARAAMVRINYSPILRASRSHSIKQLAEFTRATFARELAANADPGGTVDRIVAATVWSNWSFYRDDLGYSVEKTRAQLEISVHALLDTSALTLASAGRP